MQVVNVKVAHIRQHGYNDLRMWMEDPNNLYIGRRGIVFIQEKDGTKARWPKHDSPWANPYKVGKEYTRDEAIAKYRSYILEKIQKGEVSLHKLEGKTLGCWCKPDSCHGDVLVELAKANVQIK